MLLKVMKVQMKIMPRIINRDTTGHGYQSHFNKICVINGWEEMNLQYIFGEKEWKHVLVSNQYNVVDMLKPTRRNDFR